MKRYRLGLAAGMAAGLIFVFDANAAIHYVKKGNAGSTPYGDEATAAPNIQTAIDYASVGATVMVYAATYDVGGRVFPGFNLTNRVVIDKAVSVRSVGNDPQNTIIKGSWHPVSTNGPSAVRCVFMAGGSSLVGFTVTNGATLNTGDIPATYEDRFGGGIMARSLTAVISNCTVTGNAADGSPWATGGGGVSSGTLYDCRIIGNRIGPRYSLGGGTFGSTLYNCLIARNVAYWGGGAFNGKLYDCVISNNIADKAAGNQTYSIGGGISGWNAANRIRAYNCTIISNRADYGGGVGDFSIVSNCTVRLNKVPYTYSNALGGGAYGDGTVLVNCRVTSNTGGGVYRTYTTNCVIAYNTSYAVLRAPSLVNCLVYGNGYGVYIDTAWYALWRVESCTIVGNAGRGLDVGAGNVLSRNNIIFDNQTDNWRVTGGALTFSNTCTTPAQGGWAASNFAADPKLVALGSGYGTGRVGGDCHLSTVSPCLNAGLIQAWMSKALDLDGNPRIDTVTGKVDMGCFERRHVGTSVLVR